MPHHREGGHGQGSPSIGLPIPDGALAAHLAGIAVQGRHAYQHRDPARSRLPSSSSSDCSTATLAAPTPVGRDGAERARPPPFCCIPAISSRTGSRARCSGVLCQRCGLHRIERLMREKTLRARPRRRGLPQDRGQRSAIAGNVLDRQFQADAPNQKQVADFTYIWTAEGCLYAAAVLDLYSRRIVDWSTR